MENASQVVANYIKNYPKYHNNISAELLQQIYHELRPLNKISVQQTKASIQTICFCDLCLEDEVLDVLQEMDRRSFLMKDIEWEFAMLAGPDSLVISVEQAEFLFRCYCGHEATEKWNSFTNSRLVNQSPVSLTEIEVILCSKLDNTLPDIDSDTNQDDLEKDTFNLDDN